MWRMRLWGMVNEKSRAGEILGRLVPLLNDVLEARSMSDHLTCVAKNSCLTGD